jgi:hypothetical protein
MTEHKINIRAVAWQEGGQWVAQGIEYDIVAHANDISLLPRAFARAVAENLCISVHLGREPMQGIKEGPEKYREIYEQAEAMLSLVRAPSLAPEITPDISIRVVPQAAVS